MKKNGATPPISKGGNVKCERCNLTYYSASGLTKTCSNCRKKEESKKSKRDSRKHSSGGNRECVDCGKIFYSSSGKSKQCIPCRSKAPQDSVGAEEQSPVQPHRPWPDEKEYDTEEELMAVMEEDMREESGASMEDSSAAIGEQEESAMSDTATTETEASESDASDAEDDEELPTQWF